MRKTDPDYQAELEHEERIEIEDEIAVEEALRKGRLKCIYATKATRSKNIRSGKTLMECQVYPVFGKNTGGKRKKKKPSAKAMRNLNEKNARRQFLRLCNINFGEGDLWATFSFDKDHLPKTPSEMKKWVSYFIRKLQRMWAAAGLPGKLKYIYVLEWEENGEKIRPHVHMLLSGGLDRDQIEAAWKYGKRNQTRRIYEDDDFLISGLGTYLSKNPKGTKRWYASKGLKKPEVRPRSFRKFTRRKVEKSVKNIYTMQQNFEKAYPGYRFLDAEIYHNPEYGTFYIYARLIRDKGGG